MNRAPAKLNVVFDMETGDPDDFLTLLLLLGHPKVELRAVTVTPGSRWQIGVVRWALNVFDREIPVGAFNISHPKPSVSSWHYKRFVSKNVCHGVIYDDLLADAIKAVMPDSLSLQMIAKGLGRYAADGRPKKLHDLLAACCAIDESIGEWAEVEMFRSHGEWGARLCPGSGTWIIVDYDRRRFIEVFVDK